MIDSPEVVIARMQEQIAGLRDQQRAYADATQKLFDRLFEKIDVLEAALNRGRGVFTASLTFAGMLGAGGGALIEWLMRK